MKLKDLNETEKNILKIIIALSIFAVFLIYIFTLNYNKKVEEKKISEKTVLVTDNSRYMSVINCVRKYLLYVQSGNKNDMLLLLNDEYKSEYNITENNVLSFVPELDENLMYDYVGKEMYSHRISKNVVEFYVKGSISASMMDEAPSYRDYDLTVILYENKLIFSVKPGIGGLNV